MGDGNYEKVSSKEERVDYTSQDGKKASMTTTTTDTEKRHFIKKLNSRIRLSKDNSMDLFRIQEKICFSSNDIKLFRGILVHTSREHLFSKSAVELANEFNITRPTASNFLKKCRENNLLFKVVTNKYLVNPFMFTPPGAQSDLIAKAQLDWSEYEMKNPDKSKFIKPAQDLIDKHELTNPLSLLLHDPFFMNILVQSIDGKVLSIKQIDALKNMNIMPQQKQGFPGA